MKPPFAVVGAVTLLTVCALTAAGPTARAATDGQTVAPAGTRLLPTVHPPVPVRPECSLVRPVPHRSAHTTARQLRKGRAAAGGREQGRRGSPVAPSARVVDHGTGGLLALLHGPGAIGPGAL